MCLAVGCSPPAEDTDDVYPRNCGVEGPVDLMDLPGRVVPTVTPLLSREHYLVQYETDEATMELWGAQRCGEHAVRIEPVGDPEAIGVVGDAIVECDRSDPRVYFHDPAGIDLPRLLFDHADGCHIVAAGRGLAVRSLEGEVWFHPDPSDPKLDPILVTKSALSFAPDDYAHCSPGWFSCSADHFTRLDFEAAGDQLLVVLGDKRLLAFSPDTLETYFVSDEPIAAKEILEDARFVVTVPKQGGTYVQNLLEDERLDFCCISATERIRVLGDWMVRGSFGPPSYPVPDEPWTTLRWLDLDSGERAEFPGMEDWTPLARSSETTLLVDIGPFLSDEPTRFLFWPASGWRQPIDFPGEWVWASGTGDGAFAYGAFDGGVRLSFLPGPDDAPRTVLENVASFIPTRSDRVLYNAPHGPWESAPLRVIMPDGSDVEIEPDVTMFTGFRAGRAFWPIDTDETIYVVPHADGTYGLRRTVLP